MHRIVLLGPPASGKGTQGRQISGMLDIPTLGTGNILRREVELGSDIGKEVEGYLSTGQYVPDELVMRMVKKWLAERPGGWLLDGFPRTLPQAEALEHLGDLEGPTMAIALDVGREEIEKRMMSRRECEECGHIVAIQTCADSTCGDCGGKLVKRSDDELDSFKVRYANYEALTLPLFDYYQRRGILVRVDGSKSPDEVFSQIKAHF